MAGGSSNQGIADALVISLRAVEKYVLEHLRQARPPVHAAASRGACWRCCCSCAPDAKYTRNPAPETASFPPFAAALRGWDARPSPRATGAEHEDACDPGRDGPGDGDRPAETARPRPAGSGTWRPAWATGAPPTGRPRSGAGSRSWRCRAHRTRGGSEQAPRRRSLLRRGGPRGTGAVRRGTQAQHRARLHPEQDAHDPTTRGSGPRSSRPTRSCLARAYVRNVVSPLGGGDAAVSRRTDAPRSSTSRSAAIRSRRPTASARQRTRWRRCKAAHPELRVDQFGDVSSEKELNDTFASDLGKAEMLSLPITLVDPAPRVRLGRGRARAPAARASPRWPRRWGSCRSPASSRRSTATSRP